MKSRLHRAATRAKLASTLLLQEVERLDRERGDVRSEALLELVRGAMLTLTVVEQRVRQLEEGKT